ncbi:MAG: response regulator transcription factor [Actinomycetota bacterium]
MAEPHLLVVDDEENLRSMLAAALQHHGYRVSLAGDGNDALIWLETATVDLIVLDVMMPNLDGLEVCNRLRARGDQTPVLFLTARSETADKVRGLRVGGDDYLEKPFSLDELAARIEAILRRTGNAQTPSTIELADLTLDDAAHLVQRGGVTVHLSPTEYRLLHYLLLNRGRVVSKHQILEQVWGYDDGDGGVVETYVGYLRRKLDATEPKLIHTIRGIGYTMRVEP